MPWRQPALGPHSSHGYEVAALSPISHLYPRQEEKTTRQREGGRGKEKGETEEEEMRSVYFRKKKKIRNTQQTSTRVWFGVVGGFCYTSVCKIGTKERDAGIEIGKSVKFGHSHEILGRTPH